MMKNLKPVKKVCKACNETKLRNHKVGYADFEEAWGYQESDNMFEQCFKNCPFKLEHLMYQN